MQQLFSPTPPPLEEKAGRLLIKEKILIGITWENHGQVIDKKEIRFGY